MVRYRARAAAAAPGAGLGFGLGLGLGLGFGLGLGLGLGLGSGFGLGLGLDAAAGAPSPPPHTPASRRPPGRGGGAAGRSARRAARWRGPAPSPTRSGWRATSAARSSAAGSESRAAWGAWHVRRVSNGGRHVRHVSTEVARQHNGGRRVGTEAAAQGWTLSRLAYLLAVDLQRAARRTPPGAAVLPKAAGVHLVALPATEQGPKHAASGGAALARRAYHASVAALSSTRLSEWRFARPAPTRRRSDLRGCPPLLSGVMGYLRVAVVLRPARWHCRS